MEPLIDKIKINDVRFEHPKCIFVPSKDLTTSIVKTLGAFIATPASNDPE